MNVYDLNERVAVVTGGALSAGTKVNAVRRLRIERGKGAKYGLRKS